MIPYAIDPDTLNEVFVDREEVHARIRKLDVLTHQRGYSPEWFELADEQIVLLLSTGNLEDALGYGCWAVEWAKCEDGFATQLQRAEARLAHVHQRRGEYLDSTMTFIELLDDVTRFDKSVLGFVHHLAGRNDYAQGIWGDAGRHFLEAVGARLQLDDPAAVAESTLAVRAALRRQRQAAA